MSKDADAFRTISEVAADLGVPQHVLRFWETRFPQIQPLKRGGNRRYYRRDEIDLLKAIRSLLYDEGYTIKGVQRILKEQGVRAVAALANEAHADRPAAIGAQPTTGTQDKIDAASEPAAPAERADDAAEPPAASTSLGRQLADLARELDTCAGILAGARSA